MNRLATTSLFLDARVVVHWLKVVCINGLLWLFSYSYCLGQEEPLDTSAILVDLSDLFHQADKHRWTGNYDQAFDKYVEAKSLSELIGSRKWSATAISEMGATKIYTGRFSDALRLLHAGLKVREALNDSADIANSYNYIASVHHYQKNYKTASDYYIKSLEIRENLDDERALGLIYNNLGSLYEDQGKYDQAMVQHEKSMTIWRSMMDTSWISISLYHIGICHQKQGQLETAHAVFTESMQLTDITGSLLNRTIVSHLLGALYVEKGDYELAKVWCEKSLRLAENRKDLAKVRNACQCLNKVYDKQGDVAKAYHFHLRYIAARDSVFGNERIKELTRLEMNFDFQREQLADSLQFAKDQAIKDERITRQKIGLFSSGSMLLLIVILALVIYQGKRKSDHLLLNILPEKIAEELKSTGRTEAKRLENVTVLFTDFKEFTSISEKLPPENLVAEINECFSAFDTIMEKHGVEKIKTIGDAYMAAGGVPEPSATHAEDTVRAALEIQAFMAQKLKERNGQFFEMRVGVHTGPVVAGIVGLKKFQYDIWGDTVNTASRMESSGDVGKVNISESTYHLVKDQFDCVPRGKVSAKGKGEIEMYFVQRNIT